MGSESPSETRPRRVMLPISAMRMKRRHLLKHDRPSLLQRRPRRSRSALQPQQYVRTYLTSSSQRPAFASIGSFSGQTRPASLRPTALGKKVLKEYALEALYGDGTCAALFRHEESRPWRELTIKPARLAWRRCWARARPASIAAFEAVANGGLVLGKTPTRHEPESLRSLRAPLLALMFPYKATLTHFLLA